MKPSTRKKKDSPVIKVDKSESSLKSEFEKLKSTPLTKTVTLQYRMCDDCTCPFRDIERTVGYDSPVKDGDKVYGERQKGDKYV